MSVVHPVASIGLVFPDSDGQPMAENTLQYEAIVTLKGNIEAFAPKTAFVAGDHLIYVDPRDPRQCRAPNVYVAFGRPRGHRGSYRLWEEGDVFPQVVFEVVGPSDTASEMAEKRGFYFEHGAEEYYEFDPESGSWLGFVLNGETGHPEQIEVMDSHVSPRLGMRFGLRAGELLVFRPDGSRFLSFQEVNDRAEAEHRRAEGERERALAASQQAEVERQRAESERLRALAASRQAESERHRALIASQQAEVERQRALIASQPASAASQRAETEGRRAELERQRAELESQRAELERQRADQQSEESERLRSLLRAAGIDPDQPTRR
jgi:Uma2 family endonuclease